MEESQAFHRDQEDNLPEVWPICGKKFRFIKKGKQCGKQRYPCFDCKHKYVYDSHTITSCMKISRVKFIGICNDTVRCVPINDTAKRLNRCFPCVFENRHKFLFLLEKTLMRKKNLCLGLANWMKNISLNHRKELELQTEKLATGDEPSRLRGIFHEQICIVTTTDRNGHEIFITVGRASPTLLIYRKCLENTSVKTRFHILTESDVMTKWRKNENIV